ncbi:hypothetical protein [Prochlorothrix hollandica]|uniref:NYN domain-containing protein n=1 Tax=Prochlorothrix hollandica PCC 9006 = CALU 1027 TaxID=317619 RepID=A0A0M2PVZ4_PROHO|nr:hypothetical protein [Prochlorothrix hollandica]KKJ00330.1 hypothetical protein PROH_11735 [Prochlorothrix hollandica PCC 9006 = CALU 1027]
MPISTPDLTALTHHIIETLQTQKTAGELSPYGQAKLGTIANLHSIQSSLLKAIADPEPNGVFSKIQTLYRRLFSEAFLASAPCAHSYQTLQAILDSLTPTAETAAPQPPPLLSPQIPSPPAPPEPVPQTAAAPPPLHTPAPTVAMVLLDADHFTLDRDRETYLQTRTHCKILYRVAFANWKSRGNDGDLHHRHYLLVHVPAGRDRTDGAMLTFGTSIQEHYPRVEQVFIGSNDQIFSSLATTLVQKGYQVYRITQQGDRVAVRNVETGDQWNIPQPTVPLEVLHDRLCSLCQWLHRKSPWLTLNQIEEAYERRHDSEFTDDLQNRLPDNSLLAFLQQYPQEFVLHHAPDQPEVTWVSVFMSPPLVSSNTEALPVVEGDRQVAFEQQLLPLIERVQQRVPYKYPDGFVSLSEITHEFRNAYNQGINTVCTELTDKRIGLFLQTAKLTLLKAQKRDNRGWFLAIVPNSAS